MKSPDTEDDTGNNGWFGRPSRARSMRWKRLHRPGRGRTALVVNSPRRTMKDLRSFPLVLAVLLVAALLAGARGFQGERVERPSPFEPGTRIPPAPADCPMAVMDRPPEEPRRLPQIAASPLGIPTELSAFHDPPAARSLSQAGGPNAQQRRATLHGLSAGMERPAWTDGR